MSIVSGRSFRENQNTHFAFNTFSSSKIGPFMRRRGKIW